MAANQQIFEFGAKPRLAATDAIWLPAGFVSTAFGPASGLGDGKLHLTEAYGFRGAFNHNWDPYWSSSLFGAITGVRFNGAVGNLATAKGQYCAIFVTGKTVSADFTCNPDFNTYQIGLVTRWTPVKNLTFSAEVQYFKLDQKYTGAITTAGGPGAPKPGGVAYELKDQDTVALNVRVQRNF